MYKIMIGRERQNHSSGESASAMVDVTTGFSGGIETVSLLETHTVSTDYFR